MCREFEELKVFDTSLSVEERKGKTGVGGLFDLVYACSAVPKATRCGPSRPPAVLLVAPSKSLHPAMSSLPLLFTAATSGLLLLSILLSLCSSKKLFRKAGPLMVKRL